MKRVLEKIKVGLNPQESFTQMNKDQDLKNRVRGQVMHLNPPNDEEGLEINQKWENQGPEEHEEEKRQIHFSPH